MSDLDAAAITETRLCFEPRRAIAFARWGVAPPDWCGPNDDLRVTYTEQERLFRVGHVVWGALVQANHKLYEPGEGASPAMLVYGLDRALDGEVALLHCFARRVYALKGTRPADPEEAEIAAVVTDEYARALDRPLGPGFTGGRGLATTTTMVHREHLPEGHLGPRQAVPLLVDPTTHASLILPCEYWSEPLLRAWGVPTGAE